MSPEVLNETIQSLRSEISSLEGEMNNLQSDWAELKLWVQNGVDMNEANQRHAELSSQQDVLSQRLAELRSRLAAVL